MAQLHITYQLKITTLSPLHIGNGDILRQGYDYVTHQGKTWVIDSGTLADMLLDQDPNDFDRMVKGAPAGDLIRENEYDPQSRLFRYVMQGEPRSHGHGSEVQAQIKDAWDRPYIPGSSLKGAIRTALAFVGWDERGLVFKSSMLGENPNPKFAASHLEKMVMFGRNTTPNYDLLRMLQVGDSTPSEGDKLQLLNVQVISGKKLASPIELEAIPRSTEFEASLALDGFLLRRKETAEQLGWEADQLKWMKNIPTVVNRFTLTRLEKELDRWKLINSPIRSFYQTLSRIFEEMDKRTEFLLQLGWGGGWDSKTFGDHLTKDPAVFYEVIRHPRLANFMDRQHTYQKGDRYPKSRRVIVRQEEPFMPLGWVRVRMERAK